MAGTTHGYGTADGAGTTLTMVGDGAGTTHGDIIVGAGEATSAGDGATHTMAGVGPVTMAGMDIMAGEATTVAGTGTDHITEDTMEETTPTCLDVEGIHPVFPELHCHQGQMDIQAGIGAIVVAPIQPYPEVTI